MQSTWSHDSVLSEGKKILSQIPGVRKVFTGVAVNENSKYDYCWSVRFTNKAVLESFREHQGFNTFLKDQFNANVSDLISIDYQEKA